MMTDDNGYEGNRDNFGNKSSLVCSKKPAQLEAVRIVKNAIIGDPFRFFNSGAF